MTCRYDSVSDTVSGPWILCYCAWVRDIHLLCFFLQQCIFYVRKVTRISVLPLGPDVADLDEECESDPSPDTGVTPKTDPTGLGVRGRGGR